MEALKTIDDALAEFLSRVAGLAVDGPYRFGIDELRLKKSVAYGGWGKASGVYFFELAGRVQYIGRALPGTGLKTRVRNQCTAYGDARWDQVIKDPLTMVGVIALSPSDWYWTAALEPFLIARCAPPHNRRSC